MGALKVVGGALTDINYICFRCGRHSCSLPLWSYEYHMIHADMPHESNIGRQCGQKNDERWYRHY